MVCPRCDGDLTPRQRAGIEVDVCSNCRGVWLDRGELDKLLEQESRNNDDRNNDNDDDDDDDNGPGGILRNLMDLFGN